MKQSIDQETPSSPDIFAIEHLARRPLPGMAIPGAIQFSPDDGSVTYLFSPEGNLTRQLYAMAPDTGQERLLATPPGGGVTEGNVSLDEELRRQRLRQLETGITQYAWAAKARRLLIPLSDGLYLKEGEDGILSRVVVGDDLRDPTLSPDGRWLAYVQDAELYVAPASGGEPLQVTSGARGTGKSHGLADYVAQEEMDRREGYWWSPDCQWLAFTEVDDTHIPIYRIVHQGKDAVGESAQEDHRFPFAGKANPHVRLAIVARQGGEAIWMDLGSEEDIYLARVGWMPDGRLYAQIENRAQTQLDLVCFDPETGKRHLLLRETNDIWINLNKLLYPLKTAEAPLRGGFIWGSERSGYCHLYLYDCQGKLLRPVTEGEWLVEALAGVDESRGLVYFTATKESPLQTQLYVVALGGGEPRRITMEAGVHDVVLDHACRRFVDTYQSLGQPPIVTLRDLETGDVLHALFSQDDGRRDRRLDELDLRPPEVVALASRDGETLYGAIYRPPVSYGGGPFPTIVSVYGGPSAQTVNDRWTVTADLRAQYLSRMGYLVLKLDNRGMARRGLAFESAIKNGMGQIEVRDQVDGVRWLISQGLADPDRVGIYGWSYGGYMSAMCLAQAPDLFKVAVAGAPVTHYDGYDTHYTEHFMGKPQDHPDAYKRGSVMAYVHQMQGKLLLIHGLIDENVHFRHTARLINALIQARKPYDLLLFPDERHMPRRLDDRVYLEERLVAYFRENL